MRVTRHQLHKEIHFDCSLHGQTLEDVQSAKYLGITISDNMAWGQHIAEMTSKSTKTLDFLRRNLAFPSKSTNEVVYKVNKGAKIRNRYNYLPHLTQDTNGKVTNSQQTPQTRAKRSALSQQVNRRAQRHSKHKTEQKHKKSTKEVPPWNGQ